MKRNVTLTTGRLIFLFVFTLLFNFTNRIYAQTNVTGTISTNTTWDAAGSPYTVTGDITVSSGVTLTVDPNVEVRLQENRTMYIDGTLNADSATFTSDLATPGAGDWRRILIRGSATITNSEFYYGGGAGGVLDVDKGSLTLKTSTISNSRDGIYLRSGSVVTVENTAVTGSAWPIVINGLPQLTLSGTNVLTGNNNDGILVYTSSISSDFTLPTASIPYVFNYDFTVNSGGMLTLGSDNIFKFHRARGLNVYGKLKAEADTLEKIYFTSYRNDNLGGDTNNDGSATIPGARDWDGIRFHDSSVDTANILRRVNVTYTGYDYRGAINFYDASPSVDQSELQNNYYGFYISGTSTPSISNNTVGTSSLVPIAMGLNTDPVFSNNSLSFSDNQYDAIGILGENVTTNSTLKVRNFTGIDNITYLTLGNITVDENVTLTVDEKIVWKFNSGHRLIVDGTLLAQGTDSTQIVFTSVKDDNYGNPNDTNRDGNQTTPGYSDWGGIMFNSTSTSSVMDHNILQFANNSSIYWYLTHYYSGQRYNSAIVITGTNPTISNSFIKDVNQGVFMYKDAAPTLQNNTITNTRSVPIALSMSANPTLSGNDLVNVLLNGIGLISEELSLNGTVKRRNFAGYENITYVQLGDIYIRSGAQISVEPGVVVKMNSHADTFVEGGLKLEGNLTNGKIIYTSIKDDNVGNPLDTNGDGNATEPARGDWGTIQYRGTSDDAYSTVRHVQTWFATHGLLLSNANTPVSNTLLINSRQYGIGFDGSASPTVDSVTIQNAGYDPIIMSLNADPTFSNITFQSNGSNGIAIREGTGVGGTYFPSSQTLSSDAVLSQRDVVGITNIAYVIRTTLNVGSGVKFTINPGVVIKYHNVHARIVVHGALISKGTAAEKIIFTSIADDSDGGDTNNDGNSTEPKAGNGVEIEFQNSDIDSLNIIRHSDIRYTGNTYWYYYKPGGIEFHSAYALVDSSTIQQSSVSAIAIFGSSDPVIRDNEMYNIRSTPIRMSMFSNPTFANNTALNIGSMAIGIISETWSGTMSVPQRDFGGYNNITYHLLGGIKINSGTTIKVPAGTVFKTTNSGFEVDGTLKVQGQDTSKVVFTHLNDDNFGNPKDTGNDGTSSKPGNIWGSWFHFLKTSNDTGNVVDHAVMKYRDSGIKLSSAAPTISNTIFENNNYGISLEGVSTPVVENNVFHNLTRTPLIFSLVSYPSSTAGNVISGSTYKGLGVHSETLVQDFTLPTRLFAGIPRIPYLFGSYTIGTGAILTVSPGVVMKFHGGGLTVKKGLIVKGGGTQDSLIVFTDYRDDFHGADLNSDSSATKPSIGSWSGIRFSDEALDPQSIIDHAIIKYAGSWGSDYGAVSAENASPSITNSVLTKNKTGVSALGSSNPLVNANAIHENTNYGIYNKDKTFLIDATNNWWGHDSGPTHTSNPGGSGDVVSDSVDYDPWISSGTSNPILGDASLNGNVQAFDGSLILQHVVGLTTLNSKQLNVSDVSGNGSVSAMDASYILQYVVGLIETFPAATKAKEKSDKPAIVYNISDVELDVSGKTDEAKEHITFDLNLSKVTDLLSLQLELKYNSEWLQVEELVKGSYLDDRQLIWNDDESGTIKLALAGTEPLQKDGLLSQIRFKINMDNQPGSTKLDVASFMANEKDLSKYVTSVDAELAEIPDEFAIYQNYPNPFNPTTNIEFDIPKHGTDVRLMIFNMLGQKIRTLADKTYSAGKHSVVWDGRNDTGGKVATGVYIYHLQAGTYTATKKMMLIK